MALTVYSVIVTYDDYTEDLDNIFPTAQSAILAAQNIISRSPDVYKVTVQEDDVTEKYGRSWRKTLLTKTKE